MSYVQVRSPDLSIRDYAGYCHRLIRRVYGAPSVEPSAWEAWLRAKGRHTGSHPTNVSVPIWFSHWGTYGGVYKNWGHVVAYVPGRGYMSSPGSGYGVIWFSTIAAVERFFNAKYVGWTTDISTVTVAKAVPKPAPKLKGLTVLHYVRKDKDARSKGRTIAPGKHIYLNTQSGGPSNAANIVGGVGPYSITLHVYAEGEPGDVLGIMLMWVDSKGKRSQHFNHHVSFDKDGLIRENVEFKRAVPRGSRVFARVASSATNTGNVKVTLFDSDAYLIK